MNNKAHFAGAVTGALLCFMCGIVALILFWGLGPCKLTDWFVTCCLISYVLNKFSSFLTHIS